MGESKTFIHKLADHIQSHYDLTRQELTVVFPNKRAAFYLRDELKKNSQQTIWMPQMLSIQEAFTQWSGIALADSLDMLFELIDIDAELHIEQNSDLGVFGSQATQMAKDFDEIDQYGCDAKHVFNYVLDNKKLEIWNFDEEKSKEKEVKYLHFFQSLYDYYLRLRDRLSEQGKGYYGMITRYLSELNAEDLLKKVGDRKIVFAGFNALTNTEERIIDTLVKNGVADILFDYDAYYLDSPNNEAGFFGRRYQARHPNWLKNGISNRLQTEEKHVHIISASGNALQAKALQSKLQEIHDERQAVILPDQNLLIPVLNGIPETYSGFNVSMGYPLAKTPINQLVKEYFALCRRKRISRKITENETERIAEGWYIWPVLHLMDLEIVKIILPQSEQEAFSRWKYEAVQNGKFIFEDDDIARLQHMPKTQAFLRTFLPKSGEKTPDALLDSLCQIMAFVAQTIQEREIVKESVFLLNQVSETGKIISRLQNIVESNVKYINNLQSVETLYRMLASGASLRLNSSATEGLQIMGLLETRCLDFERLHLLSANEGILPADKSQGSFIPHYIRRECGLPSYAESQAVVAYHFYHLLQSGKEIYLYFNDLGETFGGEASRFILQIKHELDKNANIRVTEESFSSIANPSLEEKPLFAKKSEETLARLHYLTQEKGLSPSALSTYLNCPLKYYLHYIADIKDTSIEEDTGTNVIGSIIHDTLEFLFADYLPVDDKLQVIDKTLFDEKIKPLWEQKLAQSISKNTPNGFPDVGFNYLNRVTIEQQLKNYLKYTSEQLKNSTLSILKTEGDLQATLQTDHGSYVFSGRADRIDQFGGLIRIIDYKTGHVDNNNLKVPVHHHDENVLDYLKLIPEKALQLLLYKYMYLKENQALSPKQVSGTIHGLKYANNIEFGLYQEAAKSNGADVDFLGDESFISDMEAMLEAVVTEMLDTNIPFVQAEDNKKCGYCDFRMICKR